MPQCWTAGSVTAPTSSPAGWGRTKEPDVAMNYRSRGSLWEQVERDGPLPVENVLDVGVRVAIALAHAHKRGVVHWDVGPHNILMRGDGEPALADLRVGPLVVEAAGGGRIPSPAYAAPEVVAGRPPTPSSDVYSLGATLFYLLAGRPPCLTYDDPHRLVLSGERPRLARDDVPPSVLAQIQRAMSVRPNDRFPDATSFATALRREQQQLGRPITVRGRAVAPTAATAAYRITATTIAGQPQPHSRPAYRGVHRAAESSSADVDQHTRGIHRLDY